MELLRQRLPLPMIKLRQQRCQMLLSVADGFVFVVPTSVAEGFVLTATFLEGLVSAVISTARTVCFASAVPTEEIPMMELQKQSHQLPMMGLQKQSRQLPMMEL
jgi:hypothetical protein